MYSVYIHVFCIFNLCFKASCLNTRIMTAKVIVLTERNNMEDFDRINHRGVTVKSPCACVNGASF